MNESIILGFFTAFPLMLVLSGAVEDADRVATSALPPLELLSQVTGSNVAAFVMQDWIIAMYSSKIFAHPRRSIGGIGLELQKVYTYCEWSRVGLLRSSS